MFVTYISGPTETPSFSMTVIYSGLQTRVRVERMTVLLFPDLALQAPSHAPTETLAYGIQEPR